MTKMMWGLWYVKEGIVTLPWGLGRGMSFHLCHVLPSATLRQNISLLVSNLIFTCSLCVLQVLERGVAILMLTKTLTKTSRTKHCQIIHNIVFHTHTVQSSKLIDFMLNQCGFLIWWSVFAPPNSIMSEHKRQFLPCSDYILLFGPPNWYQRRRKKVIEKPWRYFPPNNTLHWP